MINLRKFVVAASIVVLSAGCVGGTPSRPLQPELTPDTVNAIAECSGGYEKKTVAHLRAEWQGRSGEVIADAGLKEGGGGLLTIGNLKGKDAIDFYNGYVICIDKREKFYQTIRAKEPEGEVKISHGSVEWEEAGMFSKYDWTGAYTYIVQNSSQSSKKCKVVKMNA